MDDKQLVKLGAERLVRYAYGGLLLGLLSAITDPDWTKKVVEGLGPVLAPLAAIAIGGAMYSVFRHLIGETLIYPFHHFVHRRWDRFRGRTGPDTTDTRAYLASLGVRNDLIQLGYMRFRMSVGDPRVRSAQDAAHSELHMLWLTATASLVAAIIQRWRGESPWLVGLFTLVVVSASLLGEVRQHGIETIRMKLARTELLQALRSAELIS